MTDGREMSDAGHASPGFTGVDWDRRPVRKLVGDLFAGTGPLPSGELAALLHASVPELEAMAFELRSITQFLTAEILISVSPEIAEYGNALASWLEDLAEYTRQLATDATAHAESVVTARAEMPGAAEMDAIEKAFMRLEEFGAGIAGALAGEGHEVEKQRFDAENAAAAVMHRYEARTEPLARTKNDEPFAAAPRLAGWQEADRAKAAALESTRPRFSDAAGEAQASEAPLAAAGVASGAASPRGRAGASSQAATRPVSNPAKPKIVANAGTQVRPASLVSASGGALTGSVPAERGVTGDTAVRSGAAPAPLGAPVSAARGTGEGHVPDAALREGAAAPRQASDLYGLDIAVAPPIIGGTAPGGEG